MFSLFQDPIGCFREMPVTCPPHRDPALVLARRKLYNRISPHGGIHNTLRMGVFSMKAAMNCLLIIVFLTGCQHGATKVSAGPNGPWIVTEDGAIYAYNGSGWDQKEPPGTADDIAINGTFLTILTKPDAQGRRIVKSRNVYGGNWTTYPSLGPSKLSQVACDGDEPVVIVSIKLMAFPDSVYKYYNDTQSWKNIQSGASAISVMNGRLFYLNPNITTGNIWSRYVDGGSSTRWGENLVAYKIAGDANGYPWVATNASSNPLYKWDTSNQKWTSGFPSGPVYDMDIESYVRMYILSDPKISGGGYTLYSHELYSGGWTTYSLPSR
jgi:hypothetical protein